MWEYLVSLSLKDGPGHLCTWGHHRVSGHTDWTALITTSCKHQWGPGRGQVGSHIGFGLLSIHDMWHSVEYLARDMVPVPWGWWLSCLIIVLCCSNFILLFIALCCSDGHTCPCAFGLCIEGIVRMAEDNSPTSQGGFALRAEKSQNGDSRRERRVFIFNLGTLTLTHEGQWAPGRADGPKAPCQYPHLGMSLNWTPASSPSSCPQTWESLSCSGPCYGHVPLVLKSLVSFTFKLELCILPCLQITLPSVIWN